MMAITRSIMTAGSRAPRWCGHCGIRRKQYRAPQQLSDGFRAQSAVGRKPEFDTSGESKPHRFVASGHTLAVTLLLRIKQGQFRRPPVWQACTFYPLFSVSATEAA